MKIWILPACIQPLDSHVVPMGHFFLR